MAGYPFSSFCTISCLWNKKRRHTMNTPVCGISMGFCHWTPGFGVLFSIVGKHFQSSFSFLSSFCLFFLYIPKINTFLHVFCFPVQSHWEGFSGLATLEVGWWIPSYLDNLSRYFYFIEALSSQCRNKTWLSWDDHHNCYNIKLTCIKDITVTLPVLHKSDVPTLSKLLE